jgi:hypothetical protein
MPFKLIKTPEPNNNYDTHTITIEFPGGITRDELIEAFQDFMRACGYADCKLEVAEPAREAQQGGEGDE